MERKQCALALKSSDDQHGTFTGLLSVYGVTDLVGDSVQPGAFTKTIKDNGGVVPMLWQHKPDEPIGQLELTDSEKGLVVKGTFDLDVQRGREGYSLVKKGFIKGLSIGYETVKKQMAGGVRLLKELKLFEGSVVTFPALPVALISDVKAAADSELARLVANYQLELKYPGLLQSQEAFRAKLRKLVAA